MDNTKMCGRCRNELALTEFYKSSRRKDGLQFWCKQCEEAYRATKDRSAESKAYRARYPERSRASNDAYNRRNPGLGPWKKARLRAKQRGVSFTLEWRDMVPPVACPICSLPFSSEPPARRATLDSYDPSLGYTPDNVWFICLTCNRRKQDMTGEQVVMFGHQVTEAWGRNPPVADTGKAN